MCLFSVVLYLHRFAVFGLGFTIRYYLRFMSAVFDRLPALFILADFYLSCLLLLSFMLALSCVYVYYPLMFAVCGCVLSASFLVSVLSVMFVMFVDFCL